MRCVRRASLNSTFDGDRFGHGLRHFLGSGCQMRRQRIADSSVQVERSRLERSQSRAEAALGDEQRPKDQLQVSAIFNMAESDISTDSGLCSPYFASPVGVSVAYIMQFHT